MKPEYEDMFDYYKHTSMFWNDMIAMMSSKPSALMAVGPLRNFTENIKKISQELIESNQEIVDFNTQLVEYYQHLGETWVGAQTKEYGLIFLKMILHKCLTIKLSQKTTIN